MGSISENKKKRIKDILYAYTSHFQLNFAEQRRAHAIPWCGNTLTVHARARASATWNVLAKKSYFVFAVFLRYYKV